MTQKSLTVLVTGANGFIGTHVMKKLHGSGDFKLVAGVRSADKAPSFVNDFKVLGNLKYYTRVNASFLQEVDIVVHTAARAHILRKERSETDLFKEANVDATLTLASAAAQAGVKRFVFISSIGVNGTSSTEPFSAQSKPRPYEPYAQSKLDAELGLHSIQQKTGMEVVIIRPPLVYGPKAPGNFGLLSKASRTGLPLPLGGIENARSFVSVWNLASLITTCVDHPKAANQTFLVRDGEDVSTSDLLRKMAMAQGKTPKLFWLPPAVLRAGAALIGKKHIYHRLFDSLQVDDSATRNILGWKPQLSLDEGIKRSLVSE